MTEEETDETEFTGDSDTESDNVFSQPWNDSDVVLIVEDEEFHVHRSILSLQSPVFKAMLNGNFKDAQQEKIELKDDDYAAMIPFLKLLYPPTMFEDDEGKVEIDDGNILGILQLADKYGTINIVKQCIRKAGFLEPENTMRLLPYAARHDLPQEEILKVIADDISTKVLENYAPELGDDALYSQALVSKCHFLEKVAAQAYTKILILLDGRAKNPKTDEGERVRCRTHGTVDARSLERKSSCCECEQLCHERLVHKYFSQHESDLPWCRFTRSNFSSSGIGELLKVLSKIESGLYK